MALLSSPDPQSLLHHLSRRKNPNPKFLLRNPNHRISCSSGQLRLATREAVTIDSSQLRVGEFLTDSELHAAVRLRIRTFYEFRDSYGVEVRKVTHRMLRLLIYFLELYRCFFPPKMVLIVLGGCCLCEYKLIKVNFGV